jgi:hypothetical protein
MKHLKPYNLLEKSIWQVKKELKHFHDVLDLDVTVKELMSSLDGIHMDLKTIFPVLEGDETLKELSKWEKFTDELKEYKLKLSELFDTENLQTFSRLPMKWYWLSSQDATDLDTPIYIMFKYYHKEKWSEIQLYYVQEDIKNFLDELSAVTIEYRYNNGELRWFYKTSNSGVNWTLQKDTKKIKVDGSYKEVKSNHETATFRNNLSWDNILELSKRNDVELYIY